MKPQAWEKPATVAIPKETDQLQQGKVRSRLSKIAVLIGAMVCGEGQSNWYKGVQLITVYAIIALMFYLIPITR